MVNLDELHSLTDEQLRDIEREIRTIYKERLELSRAELEKKYVGKCFFDGNSMSYHRVLSVTEGSASQLNVLTYQLPDSEGNIDLNDLYLGNDELVVNWIANLKEISNDEYKQTLLDFIKSILYVNYSILLSKGQTLHTIISWLNKTKNIFFVYY